jgi:hypothetical protein
MEKKKSGEEVQRGKERREKEKASYLHSLLLAWIPLVPLADGRGDGIGKMRHVHSNERKLFDSFHQALIELAVLWNQSRDVEQRRDEQLNGGRANRRLFFGKDQWLDWLWRKRRRQQRSQSWIRFHNGAASLEGLFVQLNVHRCFSAECLKSRERLIELFVLEDSPSRISNRKRLKGVPSTLPTFNW